MSTLKKAKAQPIAWTIICPYCGTPISRTDGSHILDIEFLSEIGLLWCASCNMYSKIPKSVEKELK